MNEFILILVAALSALTFLVFILFRTTSLGRWYTLKVMAPLVKFQNTLLMCSLVDNKISHETASENVSLF